VPTTGLHFAKREMPSFMNKTLSTIYNKRIIATQKSYIKTSYLLMQEEPPVKEAPVKKKK
jgi:hypothetical protein